MHQTDLISRRAFQQAAVDEARRSGGDLSKLIRGWDWPQYAPLVAMADAGGLPLLAVNLSRSMTPRGA